MTRDTAPEAILDGDDAVMPTDVELEAPFSAEEVTPLARVCPDCRADQVDAGDNLRLPENYSEACVIVRCWGSTDHNGPRWCRTHFVATDPSEGKKISFDKRKARMR